MVAVVKTASEYEILLKESFPHLFQVYGCCLFEKLFTNLFTLHFGVYAQQSKSFSILVIVGTPHKRDLPFNLFIISLLAFFSFIFNTLLIYHFVAFLHIKQ